jgi:hypothetical protein
VTTESTFHIRVNGAPEQTITVKTGIYRDAVAAIPALLGLREPLDVEIWVPHLVPEYGPYHYRIEQDEYVNLVVRHVIKV